MLSNMPRVIGICTSRKDKETKPHRTRIGKLSTAGYELSEEHLRLVSGGQFLMVAGFGVYEGCGSAGTCSPTAQCDDD